MATTHAIVALNSSTAVKLTPAVAMHSGLDFTVQNANDSGYIYVGGVGVTTSNYGYRISPNQAISFEIPPYDDLYAVASTSLNAAVISMGLESKN
jgi:hypothetical protein